MKTIDGAHSTMSVAELLELALKDDLLVKGPDGKEFVVAELDEFASEAEQLRNSAKFRAFLRERSKDKSAVSISDARRRLLAKD